jgi:ribosomal protein S1
MGIEGIQGFYKTDEQKLSVGQCSLFKIRNMQSERMVNLSLCDSTKESMFYALKTKNQFDSYLPGALVNDIVVEKVCKNGVQLNIPSSQMIGYVQQNHMSNKKFSNGDKLNATIIFINPYARVVYLSMLPHLLNSTKPSKLSKLFASNQESLKVGQQIESAEVTTHTPKGVYVQFKLGPNSSQAITGFIPKRHLFELDDEENEDEQEEVDGVKVKKTKNDLKNMTREDIEKSYPLKSSLRARIYDFNLIEDLILLSCRKNILDAAFMGYDELKLGQVVKCKVKRLNPDNGGIVVSLSEFVSGFIPKIHTSDVPLSENLLNRKIKKDKELKCKIIQLDPVEKRCVLTAKQTLIKSKLTLIDSFDMLHVGLETYGFVVSIQKYGLLLGFLNEMKGLLPRQEISASLENRDLKDLYYLGQIIKCRVIDFNKEKQQIKLSLLMKQKDLTSESITSDTENQVEKIDVEFKVGDIVSSATILNVNDEKGCLTLKMPHGLKNGIIYKNQLSDLDALNELLFDYYKNNPSKQMSNLMIIQANNKSYYLTLKTTLIEYYKDQSHMIAKSFAELNTNQEHRGWIKKILENALLIELPNNLVGFCSHKSIKYLNQMKQCAGLNQGQSVIVRINKLIADKNQFITNVLTRHDLTQRNAQESSFLIDLFKSYLANTHRLFDFYSKHNKLKTGINPSVFNSIQLIQRASGLFKIGSIVQVAVKSHNRQTGLIECLFLDELKENDKDNLQNLIGYAYETEKAYEEGTKLSAMILAFDPLAKVFCLNVDKKKVKIYSKNFDASLTQTANCKVDQCVKAEILYVSNWFCIVGLKAHALGSLAFMPLFRNDFTQIHTFSSFNQQKATTSGNDLSSLSPNARQSLDLIDSKIKQQQVVAVSSAIVSSLGQNEPAKGKKGDKRFNYFKYGQKLRVTIKQNKSDELNYLIVVSEPKSLKQNKKMLLKHLSILNENNSETSRKRQLSDSDEPILVKKKLVLSERKRKLSEQNNDFIEIVTDVRKSEPKKSKVDETVSEQDVNLSEVFPWEVTDFDQFNAIINKTFETNESKSSTSKKNSNTATPAKPSKADLSLSNQLKAYEVLAVCSSYLIV